MRIDHLSVTNFKNFAELSVDFEPGVNLIVGSNGVGKTSILEAVNVAIGGFFASQGSKYARYISLDDVRINERIRQAEASVSARSEFVEGGGWTRTFRTATKANDIKGVNPIGKLGREYFERYFMNAGDRTIAPLISYYSTQRLFRDSNNSEKQKYDPHVGRLNGYLLCLRETAIKGVLEEWLRNAVVRRASKIANQIFDADIILENVEQAVKQTLKFALDIPNEVDLRIYPDIEYDNEIFVRYDSNHDLPLSYYSDGFRNLVYLVIDLVWRASQLNPWLTLEGLREIQGVVTIDEIDLHLHPRWQMKAVDILLLFFPNVQFFITTHSPTVVSNLQKGCLYVVDETGIVKHKDDFFGKQVDNIMRNILGAPDRNIPTQQKIDHLLRLIDENNEAEYSRLLNELIKQLGQEDADIQKAQALITIQKYQDEE